MQHIDRSVAVHLTKKEIECVAGLLDMGIKAVGLRAATQELVDVINKFSIAVEAAQNGTENTDGSSS